MVSAEYAQTAEGKNEGAVARTRCGREGKENLLWCVARDEEARAEGSTSSSMHAQTKILLGRLAERLHWVDFAVAV